MTSAKYDVLGIGNAIFDILVQTDESFLGHHGMIKGGMALIDEARAASIYRDMGPAVEIMSARSRTTRSAACTCMTSVRRASRSRPRPHRTAPPPAVPTSW